MKPTVYIDGQAGTTGLQIVQRLQARQDLTLLTIDADKRHDVNARKELLNSADLVFLCLPDDAAREAVSLVENPAVKIIDASTAHRVHPDWAYGFSELSAAHRSAIVSSHRVANPGCHATGFISTVYPLVQAGLIDPNALLTCFSLTGYSGGGKKMIGQYEQEKTEALCAPRIYGLNQNHKHLPEMQAVCGLAQKPVFSPIVDDYYKGMATTVTLAASATAVQDALGAHYAGKKLVHVAPLGEHDTMLSANAQAGRDDLTIYVCGNEERCTVTALFDNLGKGASGAAVQNMNLMLGFDETTGLNI
jgi:N-acetyl-gamma-glutamyl-phosphate reductase